MNIWKIPQSFSKKIWSFLKSLFWFLLKFCRIIALLIFISVGIPSLGAVVEINFITAMPIASFPEFVDSSIKMDNAAIIEKFFRFRKDINLKEIEPSIKNNASFMTYNVFFMLSNLNFSQGNQEEGIFWYNLAKFRLRYDLVRCGGMKSIEIMDSIAESFYDTNINNIYKLHPDWLNKSLSKVVAFEKEHPAKNGVDKICKFAKMAEGKHYLPLDETQWSKLHDEMLKSALDFINTKDEPAAKAKTGKAFNKSAKDH